jgi:hypothetical protein
MKTEFVLVDFENVQPKNMTALVGGPFQIKVFLGAAQAKIPLDMARALQAFGPDAEYIQIDGHGSNALDFHIAYYIGKLAVEHPQATFCIVSKDTGFDPLIRHLKARKITCRRTTAMTDLAQSKRAPALSAAPGAPARRAAGAVAAPVGRFDAVVKNLTKRAADNPRRLKTLTTTIRSLFAHKLSDGDVQNLLEQLTQRGIISVTDGKVTYSLP